MSTMENQLASGLQEEITDNFCMASYKPNHK